jgi:hypothetical protein
VRHISSSGYGRVAVGGTKAVKAPKAATAPAIAAPPASAPYAAQAAALVPAKRGRQQVESPAPPVSRAARSRSRHAPRGASQSPQRPRSSRKLASGSEGEAVVAARAAALFGDQAALQVRAKSLLFSVYVYELCICKLSRGRVFVMQVLLDRKVKGPKYQFKEKVEAYVELVKDLRAALVTAQAAQHTFVAEVKRKERAAGGAHRAKTRSHFRKFSQI